MRAPAPSSPLPRESLRWAAVDGSPKPSGERRVLARALHTYARRAAQAVDAARRVAEASGGSATIYDLAANNYLDKAQLTQLLLIAAEMHATIGSVRGGRTRVVDTPHPPPPHTHRQHTHTHTQTTHTRTDNTHTHTYTHTHTHTTLGQGGLHNPWAHPARIGRRPNPAPLSVAPERTGSRFAPPTQTRHHGPDAAALLPQPRSTPR